MKYNYFLLGLLLISCTGSDEDTFRQYIFHDISGTKYTYRGSGVDSAYIANYSQFQIEIDSFIAPERDSVVLRNSNLSGQFYNSVPFQCDKPISGIFNCKTLTTPESVNFIFVNSGDKLSGDFDYLTVYIGYNTFRYYNYRQDMKRTADSLYGTSLYDSIKLFNGIITYK